MEVAPTSWKDDVVIPAVPPSRQRGTHTTKVTNEALKSLGFRVLPHPPYSPDLAPSDYHLFRSLQWFLQDKSLETEEDVKSALDDFFASKDIVFLPKRNPLPRSKMESCNPP